MRETITQFIERHRDLLPYVVCGALTTLVNWAVFVALYDAARVNYMLAHVIAWCAAVAFAFFTNRRYVFHSARTGAKAILLEGGAFVLARLFSFGCETALLFLGVDVLKLETHLVKLAVMGTTMTLNYLTSKQIVFRESKK